MSLAASQLGLAIRTERDLREARPRRCWGLLGRVLKTVDREGSHKHLVDSAAEYVATLEEKFGLELLQAADLWPKIVRRHKALFGT
jgi:hypothetical protein